LSDDDKLNRDIVRGAQAHALMQHDLLQEAFARLEADYIAAWRASPARDTDGRERLWQAVNVVGLVRSHLVKIVSDGKLAQRQLDELAGRNPAAKPR
jgi:hypothetical protein